MKKRKITMLALLWYFWVIAVIIVNNERHRIVMALAKEYAEEHITRIAYWSDFPLIAVGLIAACAVLLTYSVFYGFTDN
jgi:uncharacterized membrane protein